MITVGTSVLRNALKLSLDEDIKEALERLSRNEKACVPKNVVTRIAQEVVNDPKRLSAELNALARFYETVGLLVDEVRLLCTDTLAGEVACHIIREALGMGIKTSVGTLRAPVHAYVVKALGKPNMFYVGLLNFSCCVVKELSEADNERAKGYDVKIHANLTGGFKPESAYASIILFSQSPPVETVYYIHETFRDLVLLPIFSVSLVPDKLNYTLKKEPYSEYYREVLGGEEELEGYAEKLIRCLKGSYLSCSRPLRDLPEEC